MKIHIDDIPEPGLAVELAEDPVKIEGVSEGPLDFSIASTVTGHLDISKNDGNVTVSGDINAKVRLNCSRCLKEFELPLESTFVNYYERRPSREKEKELRPEDIDVNYLKADELDTDELLLGQISLEVPMQPLHSEACKGLCPKCGADLNQGECGCSKDEKTSSKFAKLKDFKVK